MSEWELFLPALLRAERACCTANTTLGGGAIPPLFWDIWKPQSVIGQQYHDVSNQQHSDWLARSSCFRAPEHKLKRVLLRFSRLGLDRLFFWEAGLVDRRRRKLPANFQKRESFNDGGLKDQTARGRFGKDKPIFVVAGHWTVNINFPSSGFLHSDVMLVNKV